MNYQRVLFLENNFKIRYLSHIFMTFIIGECNNDKKNIILTAREHKNNYKTVIILLDCLRPSTRFEVNLSAIKRGFRLCYGWGHQNKVNDLKYYFFTFI